tara:strand:+ start:256 stop:1992 length:1737 start_codon:yes stop_codon:yes gene_type:complete
MAIGLGGIGGAAGIFVLIMVVAFWLMKQRSEHRAEYGTREERRLEQEEGFGQVARAINADVQNSESGGTVVGNVKKEVDKTTKDETKGGAPQSEQYAGQAAEDVAKAAGMESKLEAYTKALKQHSLAIEASLKKDLKSISSLISKLKPSFKKEEYEEKYLQNLMGSLSRMKRFTAMDNHVKKFLEDFINGVNGVIGQTIETENEKETYNRELIERLKKSAKTVKEIIGNTKTALKKVRKLDKSEQKKLKGELKNLSKALNDKRKELKKIRKSKNADPATIRSLKKEIGIMGQQKKVMNQINNQLRNTYREMDREIKGMRRILKRITKTEKQVKKHEKTAGKREKELEKRNDKIEQFAKELKELSENETITNPHDIAIQFSGKLNTFYDEHKGIVEKDKEFDEEVRNILLLEITVDMQMKAFERLSESLDNTEAAVKRGIGASIRMVQSIIGGNQQANLNKLVAQIQKLGYGGLNYELRIERYLEELTNRIEENSRSVNEQFNEFIAKHDEFIRNIEEAKENNSSYVGSAMATMVNRKVEINRDYIGEAQKFGNQLNKRNAIAARAYRQARGLEAKRAA